MAHCASLLPSTLGQVEAAAKAAAAAAESERTEESEAKKTKEHANKR